MVMLAFYNVASDFVAADCSLDIISIVRLALVLLAVPFLIVFIANGYFIPMPQMVIITGLILAAGIWGKVKTVVQLFMCLDYIIMPEFLDNGMEWFAVTGVVLMYLATALTVISLIDYIVRNRKALEISYK